MSSSAWSSFLHELDGLTPLHQDTRERRQSRQG